MLKKMIMFMVCLGLIVGIFAQTAPSFTIEMLDGSRVRSDTLLENGPLFIDFWATWCQPCLRAMPIWSDFAEKYPGMNFYAVSIDKPRDKSKVTNQVRTAKYAFEIGFDPNKDVASLFNVGEEVPHLFIISQSGEIVFEKKGYSNGDEVKVEEAIKKLLQREGE